MKPINVNLVQLRDILAGVTHAEPFSATTLTKADAKKMGNFHGSIFKLTRLNGMTGVDYSSSVLKQQAREGVAEPAFQAQPRSWGQKVSPALVEHKNVFYMPARLNPALTPKPLYLIEKKNRLVAVDKAVVAPFLPPNRSTKAAAAQGVAREVVYRDFRLDSIVSLSLNGKKYRIRQTIL